MQANGQKDEDYTHFFPPSSHCQRSKDIEDKIRNSEKVYISCQMPVSCKIIFLLKINGQL
jgi:hypothetical protein